MNYTIDNSFADDRQGGNGKQQPFLNAEYHHLSKTPLAGFCIIQDGQLRFANHQFAWLLGYETPEQLADKSLLDLVHPQDRSRLEKQMRTQDSPPQTIDATFLITKKDGSNISANLRGNYSNYKGLPCIMGCLTDLSAMDAIVRYRDKYWTILNEVEDAVAEMDLKGTLVFYSDAACRMWKVSKTAWIGKNYLDFIDESYAAVAGEAYHKVHRTGLPGENIIYKFIRNDGQRIFVEDTISAVRDRTGAITGFRTVSRDITARRKAERQMAEHRIHLEAVFRSVQDAVMTVDPSMNVVEVNVAAERLCCIEAESVKGRRLTHATSHCNGACYNALRQTVQTHRQVNAFRVDCGLKQGQPQMVSVNCSPLKDADGTIVGTVMVKRDITLLRNLEKHLGQRHHFFGIIGKSKRMQDIYMLIDQLSDLDTTVLITGESGTGKEMVAKALHQSGRRAFKPFVAVHCSALADGLLESELFGHAKGAFTGALETKQGRFETAHGGTILLDEIGEISTLTQLKLLRVLQEKEFERVGETSPRKADVRVIACTNKDLEKIVASGEFRQDLYYRLKVIEIKMPPLRERKEDIPLLVEYFSKSYRKKFSKTIDGVSDEVMTRLIEYPWPGNVRELKHMMESAFVLCEDKMITLNNLPAEIRHFSTPGICSRPKQIGQASDEQQRIIEALKAARWNKSKAAKQLGISRQTLYKKLNTYGIMKDAAYRI